MRRLIGIFVDRDESFPSDGATAWRSGGRGRGRVFTDLVAHLFRDVIQGLWQRPAALETLDAAVEEADPAEQQVRIVAERHAEDDDSDDVADAAAAGGDDQRLCTRWASADIAPTLCPVKHTGTERNIRESTSHKTAVNKSTEGLLTEEGSFIEFASTSSV